MHAAFLRSINVGGRRVKNPELIAAFEAIGLANVAAYQAAGNLVFTGAASTTELEAGLRDALGFEVPVLLRSIDEVAELGSATPFSEEEYAASTGKVQVAILATTPSAEQVAVVKALETEHDRLQFVGAHLFWLPAGPMSESKLDVKRIERTLGLQTVRTQGTLQRMARKFG